MSTLRFLRAAGATALLLALGGLEPPACAAGAPPGGTPPTEAPAATAPASAVPAQPRLSEAELARLRLARCRDHPETCVQKKEGKDAKKESGAKEDGKANVPAEGSPR